MTKVILTDCDEVLFDWASPFEAWVRETYPEHRDALGNLTDYWHVEAWLGTTLEESREMIRIFNGDPKYWNHFKPLPGVVENVLKLHDEGFKFVAITACAEDRQTWEGRWQNLNDVFGFGVFDALHCVGLASSKAGHLARYKPTFWVEDKMKHASAGADHGHKSFLINYKHNEQYSDDRVTRVDDWHEIYEKIYDPEALEPFPVARTYPGNQAAM
jgi:5'(3')-deoxyribonucleotidase